MLKAIWMSDLHFAATGDVIEHDSRLRINAAIEHVNNHQNDSSFCILSGDLVNRGAQEDYAALKTHLDDLNIPYFPMVGNHDDRNLVRSILPLPENCMSEFIQYSISTPEGLVICLDTQKPGSDAGEFCPKRARWLGETLTNANGAPAYVFMHHPPLNLGLPMQDSEKMENGEAFLETVKAHPNVKYLFIGHVHRPICGSFRDIPFATMRSVLYQAPAPQPAWDWDSFAPSREAPNLGVLTISGSDVILQYTQFSDYQLGTPPG
jgi:Icc protein